MKIRVFALGRRDSKREFAATMRTATLIVAAVSGLSLAMPSHAQQARGVSYPAPVAVAPAAPVIATPAAGAPGVRPMPQRPGMPRPGGWQPARPPQGGWKPGTPHRPGIWKPGTPRPGGHWQSTRPGRWGQRIDGRWHAGWKAPGGWGAYRRPVRGWTLPSYWIGGGFWINDWSSWGLSAPAAGYDWVRYYDDAVLIDRRGRVWDSVSGLDWDRDGHGYDHDEDGYYAEEDHGYGADYDGPGYDDESEYERDVRLRHHDRYEYRGGYGRHGYAARPLVCVANCYNQGYYAAPASTTVVIQSAPVVTTTTTVTEEYVTYGGRKVVRRAPTKKLYRAPVKSKTCYCR